MPRVSCRVAADDGGTSVTRLVRLATRGVAQLGHRPLADAAFETFGDQRLHGGDLHGAVPVTADQVAYIVTDIVVALIAHLPLRSVVHRIR